MSEKGATVIGRFLWRCIPTPWRHRLYRSTTTAVRESDHPFFRGIRLLLRWWRAVTLFNNRWNALALWPETGPRTFDNFVLAAWMSGLRYHDLLLRSVWRWGHLLRKRGPRAVPLDHRRNVLHVTGSFDLGGTQTQIKFLCTATDATYVHQAVEVFPELNYLYRQGVAIDPGRYVKGGWLGRMLGRLVANMNYRSSQIVQIYKLVCDIEAQRPAVAVGWGHEMCVTTFIAASIARVPHIVFCIRTVNPTYGWVPAAWARMLLGAHKRMLPSVSLVAVNSTLLRDDHAAWVGMDAAAIAVCANGIDLEPRPAGQAAETRARVRRELGIAADVKVIINVGRFSGEKGQHSLVYANRLLLARGIPHKIIWLLCGDGPTLSEVEGLAAGFGMTNMIFLGRTSAVADLLAAADIFVMPSDFEGMPNAMLEAMTAGLPSISTRRSGAVDVAREGREALYYDARDAVTLAERVLQLLDDPRAAGEMGAAAAARVKDFPIGRFVRGFENALDDAIQSPISNRS